MKIEPRCPFCNAQGLNNIAAKKIKQVLLLYCGQCGAIHGVAPVLGGQEPAYAPRPAVKKRFLRNKQKPSELERLTHQVDGDPIPPTVNEAYHSHIATEQRGDPLPRAEPKRKQYTAPGPDPFPRQPFDAGEYNQRTKNQPAITPEEEQRLAEAFDKLSPDEAALMYQYWGTYGEDD